MKTKTIYQYALRADINDELVQLWTSQCGLQMWSRGRLRKQSPCAVTRQPITNGWAWRPITNRNNRARRISDAGMDKLKSEAI